MSSKRGRSDSTAAEGERPSKNVRSDSIWFTDGNVILEAEGKQFRVHRGVLAQHSTVFRDMFLLAQPSDGPAVDDCPVVCLSDAAQDVEHFLHALYDRLYHNEKTPPFSFVAAMIRLGHKYGCIQLRDDALSHLTTDCPSTLHEWDLCGDDYFNLIKPHPGLVLDILALAREQRLFSILPTTYYNLCAGPFELADVIYDSDGAISISKDDLLKCITGAKTLHQAKMETFKWLDEVPYVSCTSPKCGTYAKQIEKTIWQDRTTYNSNQHALSEWSPSWEKGLCVKCAAKCKSVHSDGREKAWESLPKIFGLPDWNDLTNFD